MSEGRGGGLGRTAASRAFASEMPSAGIDGDRVGGSARARLRLALSTSVRKRRRSPCGTRRRTRRCASVDGGSWDDRSWDRSPPGPLGRERQVPPFGSGLRRASAWASTSAAPWADKGAPASVPPGRSGRHDARGGLGSPARPTPGGTQPPGPGLRRGDRTATGAPRRGPRHAPGRSRCGFPGTGCASSPPWKRHPRGERCARGSPPREFPPTREVPHAGPRPGGEGTALARGVRASATREGRSANALGGWRSKVSGTGPRDYRAI